MVKKNNVQKNKSAKPINNPFKNAVESCTDIKDGYCQGLKALKKTESSKIITNNPKLLNGSVDIDKCLKDKYPEENRWDYVIGYNDNSYFIEIHPAFTSEVDKIINKKKWLETWLPINAKPLYDIRNKDKYIFWIYTERFAILKNSPQYRKLVQNNIVPVSSIKL